MKLVIVHFHLNRGGVSQVVADQLTGLDGLADSAMPTEVAICYGGRRQEWPEDLPARLSNLHVELVEVAGLDYDFDGPPIAPEELADRISSALALRGFAPDETLVHVHNHSLGKNISLPGAVRLLAERGYRLLLQLHDFAEDLRPQEYRRLRHAHPGLGPSCPSELLYPQAAHIHYAVLNDRDHSILRAAGVAPDRLHLLPNAVPERGCAADRHGLRKRLADRLGIGQGSRYVLYPARGIRRKNLGEALLWSALFEPVVHVGLTLPPLNPDQQRAYERWRLFASAHRIPFAFEVGGAGLSLDESYAACDRVITTSVAEGFGLAFLEGHLAGRPVIGRDLPEVTADFARSGITFPHLRDRIHVPVEWIGFENLVDSFDRAYGATLASYGRPPLARGDLAEAVEAKLVDGHVDFADLDASLQANVLSRVVHDWTAKVALLDANPWMRAAVGGSVDDDESPVTDANAAAIRSHYSQSRAACRLRDVYRRVMASSPLLALDPLPHGSAILDGFLRFDRFRALLA